MSCIGSTETTVVSRIPIEIETVFPNWCVCGKSGLADIDYTVAVVAGYGRVVENDGRATLDMVRHHDVYEVTLPVL
jgi:hypothetical protein